MRSNFDPLTVQMFMHQLLSLYHIPQTLWPCQLYACSFCFDKFHAGVLYRQCPDQVATAGRNYRKGLNDSDAGGGGLAPKLAPSALG